MTINRRRFGLMTGAALLAGASRGFAASYDLVIKGGRVIDPANGIDAVRDVAIAGGRIVAVAPGIAPGGAEVLDAGGKLVLPGLIDIHTHATGTPVGPRLCLEDGIIGWIDAGSKGADGIDQAIAAAKAAPQIGRVLINIGRQGTIAAGDTMDLNLADVPLAKAAIARNRDYIVGVKARLSKDIAGDNDYEALKRAEEVAGAFNLPVMIHMGNSVTPLGKLLNLMKRGDVVSHLWAPPPNSIIGDDGKLLPEVLAARQRGVWFDIGYGRLGHVRWDIAEAALAQHFPPDTSSTDWTQQGHDAGITMPNVLSVLLSLGLTLPQAVATATSHPAKVFPVFKDRGTLSVGAPADVAIWELRQGDFEFSDAYKNVRHGTQKLFASATVLGGKKVAPV